MDFGGGGAKDEIHSILQIFQLPLFKIFLELLMGLMEGGR